MGNSDASVVLKNQRNNEDVGGGTLLWNVNISHRKR